MGFMSIAMLGMIIGFIVFFVADSTMNEVLRTISLVFMCFDVVAVASLMAPVVIFSNSPWGEVHSEYVVYEDGNFEVSDAPTELILKCAPSQGTWFKPDYDKCVYSLEGHGNIIQRWTTDYNNLIVSYDPKSPTFSY